MTFAILIGTLIIVVLLLKIETQQDTIKLQASYIERLSAEINKLGEEIEKIKSQEVEKDTLVKVAVAAPVIPLHDYRTLSSVPPTLATSYDRETVSWVNGMIDALHQNRVGWPEGKKEIVLWGSEYRKLAANDSPVKELANKINIGIDYDGIAGGVYPLHR